MKKKIYIGCALTHTTEEFKEAIVLLKDNLRSDFEVLDFIGLENGTPQDVFEWDMNCVRRCDLFVADCTYPAIGLGMEIGIAIENNKPMLLVAQEQAKVSRTVLGIMNKQVTFRRYRDYAEVTGFIKDKMKEI